jgi:hypothetical protein
MMNARIARTAAAAALLSVATAAGASADTLYGRNFYLNNNTNSTIVAAYLRPSYEDGPWTAITGQVVSPGNRSTITVTGFSGVCYFDIEADLRDGTTESIHAANLCRDTDINVN